MGNCCRQRFFLPATQRKATCSRCRIDFFRAAAVSGTRQLLVTGLVNAKRKGRVALSRYHFRGLLFDGILVNGTGAADLPPPGGFAPEWRPGLITKGGTRKYEAPRHLVRIDRHSRYPGD